VSSRQQNFTIQPWDLDDDRSDGNGSCLIPHVDILSNGKALVAGGTDDNDTFHRLNYSILESHSPIMAVAVVAVVLSQSKGKK